jgi:hypothetical protein
MTEGEKVIEYLKRREVERDAELERAVGSGILWGFITVGIIVLVLVGCMLWQKYYGP